MATPISAHSISPAAALDLWVATLRAEGYAKPKSIAWMAYCCRRFLEEGNLPETLADVDATNLFAWTDAMRARHLKAGAIRSYQSAVWAWMGWCYREGYLPIDLPHRVRRHRPDPEPKRRTASREHVNALVSVALDRREKPYRNAALILVLAATGARRGELAMTTMADLDIDAGCLRLRHTKTDKPRTVPFDAEAKLALLRYLHLERGMGDGPLFVQRQRQAMSSNAMRCMIASLVDSARAKFPGLELSSHDLRRLCASELLEGDLPMDSVQQQLGHTTPAMTLIYGQQGREKRLIEAYHAFDQKRRNKRA